MKKILITGASGGIGTSIAEKFFKENFKLIVTSSSNEKLEVLKKKYGSDHFFYNLNFNNSDFDEKINIISDQHKDIDIIVNNAGTTDDSLILRMGNDQWDKVMNANLTSNFKIIKYLLPNMLKQRFGKIIGISSVVASSGNPGQSNYVAAKSGLIGLYKSVALEVASRNINVNLISPGFITSPMTEKLNESQKDTIMQKIPMKRFGKPSEIANLVYFLSTDESSYITGQNFHVNGGMLMV